MCCARVCQRVGLCVFVCALAFTHVCLRWRLSVYLPLPAVERTHARKHTRTLLEAVHPRRADERAHARSDNGERERKKGKRRGGDGRGGGRRKPGSTENRDEASYQHTHTRIRTHQHADKPGSEKKKGAESHAPSRPEKESQGEGEKGELRAFGSCSSSVKGRRAVVKHKGGD